MKPERLAEGKEPKHCALSLVGEPIMYPEINTLVRLLHQKDISTFLVTNAQFPEAIRHELTEEYSAVVTATILSLSLSFFSFFFCFVYRKLVPVTQLYVSVDASTKDSLKKIDRPLFRDFWPRFLSSLKELNNKVNKEERESSNICLLIFEDKIIVLFIYLLWSGPAHSVQADIGEGMEYRRVGQLCSSREEGQP